MTDRPNVTAALDALESGIAAARQLGLDVGQAEAVRAEASGRLGIAGDAYVLALIGGTGVGKSTLLNALGGEVVSPAGPRRPTTGRPVAWVAEEALDDLRPLLDRLEVNDPKTHRRPDLAGVVVLDLPDVDSLEVGHRAAVEAVLPKVDVVAWVTDPEKYADGVLHDDFLRMWMPRLDRQIVVLNKADRLPPQSADRVGRDLGRLLALEMPPLDTRRPAVILASAIQGDAGIRDLRGWLAEAADAKAVVAARLAAAARSALRDLGHVAGVAAGEATPLIAANARKRAVDAAVDDILRVVDLPGTERQAVAATRARARRRGTGPIGIVTTLIYRATGRERRAADPTAYVRGWRGRGGLTRAGELVRDAITEALPDVPPALRPAYAAATAPGNLERRLETTLDSVIARQPVLDAPSSRLWPLLGALQTANTLLLVFAVAWVIAWVLLRPPVATIDLPVLGPVPAPMILLAVALAIGYVLARALSLHAGWLGRRWARRLAVDLRVAVADAIAADALQPIDRLESARDALAEATRAAR